MRLLPGVALAAALVGCGSSDPDFALVAPSETVTLHLGQVGEVAIEVDREGGLSTTIVVTAGGLRAGITPGALTLGPDDVAGTLSFAVETSATTGPIDGAYVVGVAGDLERTAPLVLEVAP